MTTTIIHTGIVSKRTRARGWLPRLWHRYQFRFYSNSMLEYYDLQASFPSRWIDLSTNARICWTDPAKGLWEVIVPSRIYEFRVDEQSSYQEWKTAISSCLHPSGPTATILPDASPLPHRSPTPIHRIASPHAAAPELPQPMISTSTLHDDTKHIHIHDDIKSHVRVASDILTPMREAMEQQRQSQEMKHVPMLSQEMKHVRMLSEHHMPLTTSSVVATSTITSPTKTVHTQTSPMLQSVSVISSTPSPTKTMHTQTLPMAHPVATSNMTSISSTPQSKSHTPDIRVSITIRIIITYFIIYHILQILMYLPMWMNNIMIWMGGVMIHIMSVWKWSMKWDGKMTNEMVLSLYITSMILTYCSYPHLILWYITTLITYILPSHLTLSTYDMWKIFIHDVDVEEDDDEIIPMPTFHDDHHHRISSSTSSSTKHVRQRSLLEKMFISAPTSSSVPKPIPTPISTPTPTPTLTLTPTPPTPSSLLQAMIWSKIDEFLKLDADSGWKTYDNYYGVAISKKEYASGELPAFRGVASVAAPPVAVMDLISEPQYKKSYDEIFVKSDYQHLLNKHCKIEQHLYWCPPGFTPREFLCVAQRVKMVDGTMIAVFTSCEWDGWKVPPKRLRAICHIGGFIIRPDPKIPHSSIVTYIARIDLVGALPEWGKMKIALKQPQNLYYVNKILCARSFTPLPPPLQALADDMPMYPKSTED